MVWCRAIVNVASVLGQVARPNAGNSPILYTPDGN